MVKFRARDIPQFDWGTFDKVFTSMDAIFDAAGKNVGYPPYNVKKTGDSTYVIELAVAGFAKSDIEVTIEGNTLKVRGETAPDDKAEFIHKGIAERAFDRTFRLQDNVTVKSGDMVNGLLKITLEAQANVAKALKLNIN